MDKKLKIALIAHDRRKNDLLEWVEHNADFLWEHKLLCTGTTGRLISSLYKKLGYNPQLLEKDLIIFNSGPLGGDAEIAAEVVNKRVDLCIFLIDDLMSNPHEADIQMLIRQCRIHNIPIACNRYTADLIITSPLWDDKEYKPSIPTYVEFKR